MYIRCANKIREIFFQEVEKDNLTYIERTGIAEVRKTGMKKKTQVLVKINKILILHVKNNIGYCNITLKIIIKIMLMHLIILKKN